jgi:hypothetical protein
MATVVSVGCHTADAPEGLPAVPIAGIVGEGGAQRSAPLLGSIYPLPIDPRMTSKLVGTGPAFQWRPLKGLAIGVLGPENVLHDSPITQIVDDHPHWIPTFRQIVLWEIDRAT